MGYKITIDGPAGTGKGTLARELVKSLNAVNVDTGMIYRAFGLYVLENNINEESIEEVSKALNLVNIELKFTEEKMPNIYINNRNVTSLIRNEQVAEKTSKVAKYKPVREYVAKKQRQVAKDNNVVMEGRDIGSEIFPDAELKIFLTADAHERAKRRYNELIAKGKDTTFEDVKKQIMARDKEDMTREISPLRKTEDMIEIDSTHLTIEQVVLKVKELIIKKGLECF